MSSSDKSTPVLFGEIEDKIFKFQKDPDVEPIRKQVEGTDKSLRLIGDMACQNLKSSTHLIQTSTMTIVVLIVILLLQLLIILKLFGLI